MSGRFSIIFFPCFLLPLPLFAAAWTLPEAKWELYQNISYYRTTEYFDAGGNLRPQPAYTKYELNPFVEYGWSDDITLGASAALAKVNGETMPTATTTLRDDNYGLSDPSFHLRQRLWHDDATVIAVQPLIKLPSYFSSDLLPRSGTSQTDAELRLLGGHSFRLLNRDHFVNVEMAYRRRFGDPADQWRGDATLGIGLSDNWQLLPQIGWIRSVESLATPTFTQTPEDDYHLLKTQISAVYHFRPDMAVQAGLFDHSLGANTGAGSGMLFSLWYRP